MRAGCRGLQAGGRVRTSRAGGLGARAAAEALSQAGGLWWSRTFVLSHRLVPPGAAQQHQPHAGALAGAAPGRACGGGGGGTARAQPRSGPPGPAAAAAAPGRDRGACTAPARPGGGAKGRGCVGVVCGVWSIHGRGLQGVAAAGAGAKRGGHDWARGMRRSRGEGAVLTLS